MYALGMDGIEILSLLFELLYVVTTAEATDVIAAFSSVAKTTPSYTPSFIVAM